MFGFYQCLVNVNFYVVRIRIPLQLHVRLTGNPQKPPLDVNDNSSFKHARSDFGVEQRTRFRSVPYTKR